MAEGTVSDNNGSVSGDETTPTQPGGDEDETTPTQPGTTTPTQPDGSVSGNEPGGNEPGGDGDETTPTQPGTTTPTQPGTTTPTQPGTTAPTQPASSPNEKPSGSGSNGGSGSSSNGGSGSSSNGGSSSNRSSSSSSSAQEPERSSIGVLTNVSEAINRMQNGVVVVDISTPISSADLRKVMEAGGQLKVFSGPGVLWHFARLTNPDAGLNPVVDIGADIPDLRAKMNGVQGTIIRFMHNGVLPGTANVALVVPYAPGTTLYFYYYNRSTQLFEYQQTATVAAGGYVVVNLTHCSDYVLTTAPLTSGVASGPVPTTRNAGRLDATPHTGI